MILSKIVEDPQSGTCLNVSYSDVSGPVANFNPTGSPFANTPAGAGAATNFGTQAGAAALAALNGSLGQSLMLNGGLNLSLNIGASGQNISNLTGQMLDHIKVTYLKC